MRSLFNCHIHTFTVRAVPDGFLPLGLMRLLRTRLGAAITRGILGRFRVSGQFERALAFARIGGLKSQEQIFNFVQRFYPQGTRFVVLPMDFEFMNAGLSPQGYLQQLEELRDLYHRPEYRSVLMPFIAADARRRDVAALVRTYIDDHGFHGIKMYPALGFYPFDERLAEVWSFAEERQVPVLVHCSRGGVHGRLRITEAMRRHPLTGAYIKGGPRDFTDAYSDPDNYRPVLEKHPQLKLCLAHWGGGREWYDYLKQPWPAPGPESWLSKVSDLMAEFEGVYTDIAYTACDKDYHSLIKVLINTDRLREKVLYGSDFYMVQLDVTEREFSIGLRAYLGEEDYEQIAVINPTSFFGTLVPA